MKNIYTLCFFLLFFSSDLLGQAHLFKTNRAEKPPFWNDIQAFKKSDSIHPPLPNSILFVGSSSFTKWTDVQSYFPKYPIINRGFGGSSLTDLIRYAPDIILPYKPKQIIIYCGENDFISTYGLSPEDLLSRFKTLYKIIRVKYPKIPVDFISLKPSPSRKNLSAQFIKSNLLIKEFLKKEHHTEFIDIYTAMLDSKGNMRPELYLPDSLHMRPEGYTIWKEKILPYLLK